MPRKFTVESWLLSLYLGVAFVYWLPDVNPAVVWLLKAVLVGSAILGLFSRIAMTGLILLPRGLMGPVGFVTLLLLSIPGLVQAREPFLAIKFVVDVGICAVFLWGFYNMARQGSDIKVVLVRALIMISLVATLMVLSLLTGLTNWNVPSELDPFMPSFTEAGFSSSGGAWSEGIAIYLPITILLLIPRKSQNFVHQHVLFILVVGILIGSQLASGGRTGILVSLFTIIAFTLISSIRWMVVFGLVGVLGTATLFSLEFWVTHLRLEPILSLELSLTNLNILSTNRIKTYIMAIELLREQPIRGYGMGQILISTGLDGEVVEIHNLWLRWAVECGIFLPLFFLAMVCSVLRQAWQLIGFGILKGTTDRIVAFLLGLILLAGLALSLFSPRALIGAFQSTAVWWAAVGALLGIYHRQALSPDASLRGDT